MEPPQSPPPLPLAIAPQARATTPPAPSPTPAPLPFVASESLTPQLSKLGRFTLIVLVLRLLIIVCAMVSLVILSMDSGTITIGFAQLNVHFNDFYTYRYMLASAVIGTTYTIFQVAVTIYELTLGKRLTGGYGLYLFDFYGDKVLSYILGTGTGAGFGATLDLKNILEGTGVNDFFNKANAAAGLLLLAFLFAATSSVLSSYALPRKLTCSEY